MCVGGEGVVAVPVLQEGTGALVRRAWLRWRRAAFASETRGLPFPRLGRRDSGGSKEAGLRWRRACLRWKRGFGCDF